MKVNRTTEQIVDARIVNVRGPRVMLDADLAALYGVATKALNQAVGRNAARFPSDFMFLSGFMLERQKSH